MSRRDEGSEGGISGPYFYAVGAIVVGSRTTANYAASSDLRASTCALTALCGFGFAFAGRSKTWGGATLTLVPNANTYVDGVLYLIPDLSLSDLDRKQGCPRIYERVTVRVADDDGSAADAHAYCMRPPLAAGRPSDAYFDLVAREYHRLGIDPEPLVGTFDRAVNGAPLARGGR